MRWCSSIAKPSGSRRFRCLRNSPDFESFAPSTARNVPPTWHDSFSSTNHMNGIGAFRLDAHRMFERLGKEIGVPINADAIRKVADEQLRMIWTHMALATVAATVFAMFFAAKMMTPTNHTLVKAWIAAKLLVALPRVIQGQLYRRNGRLGGQTWRDATDFLLVLDGLVWGLAGLWVARQDVATAGLGIACLAGVAGAATFGLQARLRATAAYVVPVLGLLAVALLARGDEFGVFTGLALFLLLCMLLASAKRAERQLVEIFLLRLHANNVAQERTEAMDLALRQSAAKGQFFTTMSHELRTPLHGILGLTRLIQAKDKDPGTGRHLELIQASGNHLLALINDLLDMSYLESGEMRPREADCDLHEEIQRLVEIYAVRCGDKGLRWSASIGLPMPYPVRIDVARTRQILHNLLGNAVKFTEHGSLSLKVECQSASEDDISDEVTVSFVITDTGIGIADADQQRVFGAFQQASWTGTNALEGTGLGLSIARGLALRMGGDITCRSELGKGSCFTFTARMKLAADARTVNKTAVRHLERENGVSVPSYRVLLAEDNDVNAIIATAFLTNRGMACERVESGDTAVLRAVRTIGRPDLVLMDCLMPRLDGYEATRQIRERERKLGLRRIPVIALTALSGEEALQACFAAGMDAVLSKPFTEEDLSKTVKCWLSDASAIAMSADRLAVSA
jgi:signal transduction histidine kinase/AmiR/NasT family two-component response regulator